MAERQDIDALLVDAVYDDLSPADASRLEAHLASHPGDRVVLDGMRQARMAMREQRMAMPLAEPSPAISQLLLQEAARQAPSGKAGLWQRLMNWIAVAGSHPALAAAAVVVVVAGVAGVLRRRGDVAPEPTVRSTPVETSPAAPRPMAAAPAAEPAAPTDVGSGAVGSGADDGLAAAATAGAEGLLRKSIAKADGVAKEEAWPVQLAEGRSGKNEMPALGGIVAGAGAGAGREERAAAAPGALSDRDRSNALREPEREYAKEPAAPVESKDKSQRAAEPSKKGYVGARNDDEPFAAEQQFASGPPAAAPPPASDEKVTVPVQSAPAAKLDSVGGKVDLHARARKQHQELIGLVKRNRCTEAAKLGAALAESDPGYYLESVVNDRAISACKAAIEGVRKQSKARVTNQAPAAK
jgi:hypothetical protein